MILGGLGGLEAYFWEDFLHNRLLLKFKSSSTSLAVLHWTPLDSTLAASKGTCLNPNGMRRSPRSGLNPPPHRLGGAQRAGLSQREPEHLQALGIPLFISPSALRRPPNVPAEGGLTHFLAIF